ncbi:hypothetical protein EUGRSUZ_B01706, partial [Eucalyptus grandis]
VSNCNLFKSRLQDYAHKTGLPTPLYETIKEGALHESQFRSTVTVNGVKYNSLPGFCNRKAAEQSAAEVALLELAKSGEISEGISQPVHETGLCKNLIQEYVQKLSYVIPRYKCPKDEASRRAPLFSCTVEVGGICYTGDTARTKKQAEIQAARTALLAVQSSTPTDSQLTVPSKKRATETSPFNVRQSSPENSTMNQNGEDDAAQEQLSLRRSALIRARQNPQCF